MIPHPDDTIVAVSSAAGAGGRAVVRLSGAAALRCALSSFSTSETILPARRRCYPGLVRLAGIHAPLPTDLNVWPGPRSYTGQDLVELHTIACPPLVELLIAQLLNAGARAARPGEFTLRAFLAGKLDLTRAEAVLAVIEAGDRDELRQALAQLAGGITRPLPALREDLLNLLADVEAGLDFSEEDIRFVRQEEILGRITKALAQLTLLRKQLEQRALARRKYRVVLAGRPHAGKSSLFNALAREARALVSPLPGTTRDYLVYQMEFDGVSVELIDTAGWHSANGAIQTQAQLLADHVVAEADLILLCIDGTGTISERERRLLASGSRPEMIGIATKCDLHSAPEGLLATSAVSGAGLHELRALLYERVQRQRQPALTPSLSRCRHHVSACIDHLRHAHDLVLNEGPPELLAVDLRSTLDALGEMVGAVYTDDLLDRIFSRFCIGK